MKAPRLEDQRHWDDATREAAHALNDHVQELIDCTDAADFEAAISREKLARRRFGNCLLALDKRARPHIYEG